MAVVDASTDEQLVTETVERLLADHDPSTTDETTFLGAQFDAGLAWVHFPRGRGGLEVSPKLQKLVNERILEAGGPNPYYRNPIGHGMGAPTVVTHGSEDQQDRYLRPLFTGEEVWCQLFSEPGAGSDVAGLSGRAVLDGEEWIVNAQKVWTTLAHISRWGMLVVRTDPDQPKHKGLTYFVVDMQAPGVEVRPLRQITGDAEFNEVFFTDVRIPDAERLGDVGDGWRVSLTTLMNERVSIGGSIAPRGSGPIGEAVKLFKERGVDDEVKRDELVRLWIEAEVNRLTNIRASQNRQKGVPGPEGSTGKLAFAELNKRVYEFCMDLMGPDAMLYPRGYDMERSSTAMGSRSLQQAFLRARANSIEGGTSEIMRNILGERVLGLPGDIRLDKDRPWLEVPRS
ncbi:MAG TPA: acyl-CoA dehydrogenase family protein [Acidimicrobiales bacterium]|nr:acyl-CoA dehydrogenase family protein [Acidimicrobiales bacterium]